MTANLDLTEVLVVMIFPAQEKIRTDHRTELACWIEIFDRR